MNLIMQFNCRWGRLKYLDKYYQKITFEFSFENENELKEDIKEHIKNLSFHSSVPVMVEEFEAVKSFVHEYVSDSYHEKLTKCITVMIIRYDNAIV